MTAYQVRMCFDCAVRVVVRERGVCCVCAVVIVVIVAACSFSSGECRPWPHCADVFGVEETSACERTGRRQPHHAGVMAVSWRMIIDWLPLLAWYT